MFFKVCTLAFIQVESNTGGTGIEDLGKDVAAAVVIFVSVGGHFQTCGTNGD